MFKLYRGWPAITPAKNPILATVFGTSRERPASAHFLLNSEERLSDGIANWVAASKNILAKPKISSVVEQPSQNCFRLESIKFKHALR